MARTGDDSLFEMIHSLTGNEARYLRLQLRSTREESLLPIMFDGILEQEEFDDEKLFEKLQARFNNRGHFNVKKVNLYVTALKIMRQYHAQDENVDIKLLNHLLDVEFLFHKKLGAQAMKVIAKAKELAYSYQRYSKLVELITYEILFAQGSKNLTSRIGALQEEALEALKHTETNIHIQSMYRALLDFKDPDPEDAGFTKSMEELAGLSQKALKYRLAGDKLVEAKALAFQAEQRLKAYKLAGTESATRTQEFSNSYKEFLEGLERTGQLVVLESFEFRYMTFLLDYMERLDFTPAGVQEFKDFFKRPKFTKDVPMRMQTVFGYMVDLHIAYLEGSKSKFLEALERYSLDFKKAERHIPNVELLIVNSCLAMNYMTFGDMKRAEAVCLKIIKISKLLPDYGGDIVESALLNLVIVAAEEGAGEKLRNRISQLKEYLKTYTESGGIADVIVSYANMIAKAQSKSEKVIIYQGIAGRIKEIADEPLNDKLLSRFYYLGWFESKATGKPFSEIVAEEARRQGYPDKM